MSDPRHWFETHRCEKMPIGFSIRRYAANGNRHQWPHPGVWVLAERALDDEYWTDYLHNITPTEYSSIGFCPWCGEELGRKEEAMSDCSRNAWKVPRERDENVVYQHGMLDVDYGKVDAVVIDGTRFVREEKVKKDGE